MHLIALEGKPPAVHPDAFVAATATVIGDVTVESDAGVWFSAALRADIARVVEE